MKKDLFDGTVVLKGIAVLFLLTLTVVTGYFNIFEAGWYFDDYSVVVNNPYIKDFGVLFTSPQVWKRPVSYLVFALIYHLTGLNPTVYHCFNICVHILCAFLVFLLIGKLLSTEKVSNKFKDISFSASLIGALIFAVHPLQTQAVSYIRQSSTTLATLFYLLSFYIYIRLRERQSKNLFLIVCLALCSLSAVGSKPIALTLPFVLILFEGVFKRDSIRGNLKSLLLWTLPFLLIGIILFTLYYPNLLEVYKKRDFTMKQRLLTENRVVVFYISLFFYPHPSRLNLDHHFTPSTGLFNPSTTFYSLILLFILGIITLYLLSRHPLFGFLMIWMFLNLLMESTFLPLELAFEHRMYLPFLAPAAISGILLAFLVKYINVNLTGGGTAAGPGTVVPFVIVVFLITGTYQRNKVWENEITLWRDVIKKSPQKARGYSNLGVAYGKRDQTQKAMNYYRKAIEVDNSYCRARYKLAEIYRSNGQNQKALELLKKVRRSECHFPPVYNILGVLYIENGEFEKAGSALKKAIDLDKEYSIAYTHLGYLYQKRGKLNEAHRYYKLGIEKGFYKGDTYRGYALFLLDQKKYSRAKETIEKGIEQAGKSGELELLLARCFLELKKRDQALKHLKNSSALKPGLKETEKYRRLAERIDESG